MELRTIATTFALIAAVAACQGELDTGQEAARQGALGASGEQGEAGDSGTAGAEGPMGPTGPAGPTGNMGSPGSQGAQGLQGIAGVRGQQGIPGLQGEAGLVGSQGSPGAQGPPGATGDTGADGLPGSLVDKRDLYEVTTQVVISTNMSAETIAKCQNTRDIVLHGSCSKDSFQQHNKASMAWYASNSSEVSGWRCFAAFYGSGQVTLVARATCVEVK